MLNPNEPCSRIREFQRKMHQDLELLNFVVNWDRATVEKEADRAMIEMLRWEERQHVRGRKIQQTQGTEA